MFILSRCLAMAMWGPRGISGKNPRKSLLLLLLCQSALGQVQLGLYYNASGNAGPLTTSTSYGVNSGIEQFLFVPPRL